LTKSSPPSADHATPLTPYRVAKRTPETENVADPATDPFTRLDELMAVVEALCPVWPEKPLMTRTPNLRL